MAKASSSSSPSGAEAAETSSHSSQAAICRHVLAVLGRPIDFLRITARQITPESYRVNVVVGPDSASARISHSFFITSDDKGTVTHSCPAITKQF